MEEQQRFSIQAIRGDIRSRLDKGETAQAIYQSILNAQDNPMKQERALSRIVGGTPSTATMEQYKGLHQILVMGFALCFVGYVVYFFRYLSSIEPTMVNYVAFGLGGVFHLFLFNQLRQFVGLSLYSIIVFMLITVYYLYNGQLRGLFFENWVYGYMLLAVAIGVLSYILKRKAFPNLKYGGPKKDENGDYIF